MSSWRAATTSLVNRLMSRTDARDVDPRRREISSASRDSNSAVDSGRASIAARRCAAVGLGVVNEGRTKARSDMASGAGFSWPAWGVLACFQQDCSRTYLGIYRSIEV